MNDLDTLKKFSEHKSKYGLKSSDKRSFIVSYFFKANRHFTVEELHDEIKRVRPQISYSTVYRALKLLVRCGSATKCTFDDSAECYEPIHRSQHHDHLICRKCGRIIEFENRRIEELQKEIAHKYHFHITAHRLQLYGECSECRKAKRR